jgi:hypothetical protein
MSRPVMVPTWQGRILEKLAAGEALARDSFPDMRPETISVHVCRLRRRFGLRIPCIRGRGYVLTTADRLRMPDAIAYRQRVTVRLRRLELDPQREVIG